MYKHFSFITLLVIIQIALAAWFCHFLASLTNLDFPFLLFISSLFLTSFFTPKDNNMTIQQISERYFLQDYLKIYFSFFIKNSINNLLIISILFVLFF